MNPASETPHPAGDSALPRGPLRIRTATVLVWLVVITGLVCLAGAMDGTVLRLSPLMIFIPALLAGLGTVRQTVGASVWVLFTLLLSLIAQPGVHLVDGVYEMLLALVFEGCAVTASVWRERRDRELARLRNTAVALQRQILQPLPLVTGDVLVEGMYLPIEEDRLVGGDIYEAVESPYGTRVLIGDVQGKGLPAIGAGFAVLGAFREAAYREPALTDVVQALEEAVVRHNALAAQSGQPERFVTALVLSIDGDGRAGGQDGGQTQAINCGHLPPYLIRPGSGAEPVRLGETAVPLGMAALTDSVRTVQWFDHPADATLLLCTDGVVEARDRSGEFYPLGERLRGWHELPPADLLAAVRTDIDRFTGGVRRDDVAVLTLRRTAKPVGAEGETPRLCVEAR
ncbi:PP2C family protein-serine/threonine phosphatase [Phaeacidiphilus oryzae]|uniref:PP2C family protein-serine/threonine phosphatase n=1 Tax=Phaeacidiphilus oryzae TaxID=348818 RepID=UPI000A0019A1|nr:PP2C family protein-serine/threonine phosphatase [Phaeacidiphilus oryzae]